MELPTGTMVERYVVDRAIGSGGSAVVYRVQHVALGSWHALKVLHGARGVHHRVAREGRVQAALRHPNLVPVTDLVDIDGIPGLVMDLVDGPSLEAWLRASRPTLEQVDAVVRGILAGTAAAHRAGLVHRDLKPGNILLQPVDGALLPRITDFGLARILDLEEGESVSRAGAVVGTPAYMAPEQLQHAHHVDVRADIWSLGVILYELCTGQRPFRGVDPVRVLARVNAGTYDAPEAIVPALPARMSAAIAGALVRDPQERIASCEALLEAWTGDEVPTAWSWASEGETSPGGIERAPESRTWDPSLKIHLDSVQIPGPPAGFVGRQAEVEAVGTALRAARVVTVTGPGGVGKSALALRGVESWSGGLGSVWYVDLAEVRDEPELVHAVGRGLALRIVSQHPVDQIGHALAARGPTVVVLDGAEGVVGPLAEALGTWLELARESRFLVTSREPVRVAGEHCLPLEPLDVPDEHASRDQMASSPAVLLFARRAREVDPSYQLGDDVAEVADLVRLLDGLPLAIELAAARVRVLTPGALAARMDQRFAMLRSRRRDRPDRHLTLRAAIAGSWDGLTPWEQAALAQISVFRGGFLLDAAETVTELTDWSDAPWVVDVIEGLVERGLLRSRRQGAEPRFDTLLTIRDYAAEQLATHPTRQAAAELRHANWYARLGEPRRADAVWKGRSSELRRYAAEIDNLVVATHRALALGHHDVAARTALAAMVVFEVRGPVRAGVALGERVLDEPIDAALGAPLHFAFVRLLDASGEVQRATTTLELALVSARDGAGRASEVDVTLELARARYRLGRLEEAAELAASALTVAEELGDDGRRAHALSLLGVLSLLRGRSDAALAQLQEGAVLARSVGDPRRIAIVDLNLAKLHQHEGRLEEAERAVRSAREVFRELGDAQNEAVTELLLAELLAREGNRAEAIDRYRVAHGLLASVGDTRTLARALAQLAVVELRTGTQAAAVRALGAAERVSGRHGDPFWGAVLRVVRVALAIREGDLEAAAAGLAEVRTTQRRLRNPGLDALVELGSGELALARGDAVAAAGHFQMAASAARRGAFWEEHGEALAGLGVARAIGADAEGAAQAFTEGDTLLRHARFPHTLGTLLVRRAGCTEAPERGTWLAEAESLLAGCDPESPWRRRLRDLA